MHNLALILLIALIPSFSFANNEVIKKYVPNNQLVGKGILSNFIWDIYEAELYAPEGKFSKDQPFALKIRYLREIKKQNIAETTVSEIRKQGFNDENKLSNWKEKMLRSIPDVQDGTEITGIYTKNKNTIFYTNGDKEKVIKDKEFGEKFFDIWLGKKSSEKRLRKKLLGQI